MYPLLLDFGPAAGRQHIDELRQEAFLRRLLRSRQRHEGRRRKAPAVRLHGAPAS